MLKIVCSQPTKLIDGLERKELISHQVGIWFFDTTRMLRSALCKDQR
jgi:hypothetical protein